MRIRRPIALILSAALAAGALTGCSWEDFLEWLNSSSSSSPSSQPDSSSSQPDSSSSQVVTDNPSTWPRGDNGQLVAPEELTELTATIIEYIHNNSITALDLSKTQLKSIGDRAFSGCDSLISIDLPDGLTTIDNNAFDSCKNLKTVTLPSSVTTIGSYAFQGCTGLTSINLSGCANLTTIGDNAFYNCSTLKEIILPEKLTTIKAGAFQSCSNLTSINLEDTKVKTIDSNAFLLCGNLQTVTLPRTVTEIADGVFWGCTSLTKINLGDTGITEILNSTFTSCERLANVILPDTVGRIETAAFQGTGLTHLYFTSGEVPEIAKNSETGIVTVGAFWGVDATKLTIHYPNSWGNDNLQKLKDAIEKSGMENVNINGNTPKFESYTTLPTLSLLDAARLFGL